ncbi:MAG: hypothetical protein AB7J35_05895 [Dehalococcoidia bacterium]
MFEHFFHRRGSLLAALLAFALGLAFIGGATRTPAVYADSPGAQSLPNSSLTLGIKAIGGDGDNSWQGTVTGPNGFVRAWSQLQIGGPNYMGGQHDMVAGTYSVVAGNPVRPGWIVTGYARYETSQFLQACPVDSSAYKPTPKPVTFSDQHPNWGICVRVQKTPPPTPTVAVPTATPTVFEPPVIVIDWPEQIPTAAASATPPAKTATPTPSPAQPPAGTSTDSPDSGPARATESPARPADENSGGTTHTTNADPTSAPLPPSTGNSADRATQDSVYLAFGLLLLGGSVLIVAANRLPGRPRR